MRPGANRPILFIFNGGPGSPPTWLQYGFLGPRLAVPENGMPGSPDGALRENPDCLMDLCDLVFYHPPGAGYSRVFSERWNAQVFGDHADAQAAESFIRSFLDEHGTHRPFFLLGESFGSTRASLLSDRLSDLNLRGVVHVGPGYTGDVSIPRSVKDLIPLSATSWYYDERAGKPDLQTFLAPVRVFLYRDYLPALCQGTMLPPGERQRVAQQLEAFTGLPAAYYLAHDLHVSREDFRKERLKAKGLRIGSFDTRFTLPADETQDPTLARLTTMTDAPQMVMRGTRS